MYLPYLCVNKTGGKPSTLPWASWRGISKGLKMRFRRLPKGEVFKHSSPPPPPIRPQHSTMLWESLMNAEGKKKKLLDKSELEWHIKRAVLPLDYFTSWALADITSFCSRSLGRFPRKSVSLSSLGLTFKKAYTSQCLFEHVHKIPFLVLGALKNYFQKFPSVPPSLSWTLLDPHLLGRPRKGWKESISTSKASF